MNLADILIIIFVLMSIFRGKELGFIRQLLSTVGFFGGLLLGAIIGPHVIGLVHSQLSRALVTVLITLGMAMLLLSVGEYIGILLKRKMLNLKNGALNHVDNGFGSAIAVLSLIILVWLSSSILATLPYPGIQSAVRGSEIISFVNRQVPPAPNIIADLGRIIDPNGFPQVFSGLEPTPKTATLPTPVELAAAVNRDQASVVKIEGQGCGGIVAGSGFVVSKDLVVTNAHVIAGIKAPFVTDNNGGHHAKVLLFDPNLDIAVLQVSNLAGKPLSFNTSQIPHGTKGGVLGYPGGGPFTAELAAVIDEFTALGKNIYGQGSTERDVYSVQANIIPGNSGGPLVDTEGNVMGVIFAESTSYNKVGYALSVPKVIQSIHKAEANSNSVSTGSCAE